MVQAEPTPLPVLLSPTPPQIPCRCVSQQDHIVLKPLICPTVSIVYLFFPPHLQEIGVLRELRKNKKGLKSGCAASWFRGVEVKPARSHGYPQASSRGAAPRRAERSSPCCRSHFEHAPASTQPPSPEPPSPSYIWCSCHASALGRAAGTDIFQSGPTGSFLQ